MDQTCLLSSIRKLLPLALPLLLHAGPLQACEAPFEVPQKVLNTRLVILGELHGTQEAPHLAGELACTLAAKGAEVVLPLEMPETEQKSISTFLESRGTDADVSRLLLGEFWNRPASRQDGRSSAAKFRLLERIRELTRVGHRISVLAFDAPRIGLSRDAGMASLLRAIVEAKPQARIVVLTGNVHALKNRGSFFDRDYESLAFLLTDLEPLTLNIQHKRGSAWVCVNSCGPRAIVPQSWVAAADPGIYVGKGPDAVPRYHGTVVLEQATASFPATSQ